MSDEPKRPTVASVASAMAAYIIRRNLEAGKRIEIPSLGITVAGWAPVVVSRDGKRDEAR